MSRITADLVPAAWARRADKALAALVAGSAIATMLGQAAIRGVEARLAAPFVGLLLGVSPFGHRVFAYGSLVLFPVAPHRYMALSITSACTSCIVAVPMLLLIAALLAVGRTHVTRGLLGLAVGIGAVVAINAARIGGIAFAIAHWGLDPGYEVSHKVIGSVFAVTGFTVACLVMTKIAVGGAGSGPRGREPLSEKRHQNC